MLVKLSTNVSFVSLNGNTVMFRAGSEVWLDAANMIAFADGYHFDIAPGEFSTIH